jgi:hypothetical protein
MHHPASRRTTIVLDETTRRAARRLARRWECSSSEAIRRSVIRQHEAELGPTPGERQARKRLLAELFKTFAGHDVAAEVARLKAEDEGF